MNCNWQEVEEKAGLETVYKCANCGKRVTIHGDRMPPTTPCRGKRPSQAHFQKESPNEPDDTDSHERRHAVLHLGDMVQELATGRTGKVDNISSEEPVGGPQVPTLWRVIFSDGKQPLVQYFKGEGELRVIQPAQQ